MTFLASKIENKTVHFSFDGGHLCNDTGGLLLREIDQEIGLVERLAGHLTDERQAGKVCHAGADIIRQRVMQIACGYEDGNDSNSLRHDPAFKMMVGRLPDSGADLASQPTISRFENAVDRSRNDQLEQALVNHFIESHSEAPDVIVVDVDQTAAIGHGQQEELAFNGYYHEHCFMPLHIYEGLSGDLITTMLMPGSRPTGAQMLGIVQPLLTQLRAAWPLTLIVFRGDSHFSYPEVHDWLDRQVNMMFVTGLSGNARLQQLANPVIKETERRYKDTQVDVTRYHSLYYQADTWSQMRRVVVKVEVTAKGTNVRYVVTDMEAAAATDLYKTVYCGRGVAELYIKDHKTYLKSDRMSDHAYQANRFRLLMHSAAYILLHTLRKKLLGTTQWTRTTLRTIQLRFLKVTARVRELKTRIKIEITATFPLKETFKRCFDIMTLIRGD